MLQSRVGLRIGGTEGQDQESFLEEVTWVPCNMSRSWLNGKVLKVILGRGTACLWAQPAPLCNLG